MDIAVRHQAILLVCQVSQNSQDIQEKRFFLHIHVWLSNLLEDACSNLTLILWCMYDTMQGHLATMS